MTVLLGHRPGDLMRTGGGLVDVKTLTAGTSNAKGAWVELIASTTRDCHLLNVWHEQTNSGASLTNCLLDIGVGAASSEQVVVPDLAIGCRRGNHGAVSNDAEIMVPVFIPAGSRIAARISHHTNSTALGVAVDTWQAGPFGSPYPLGKIDVIGALASSRGVDVATGTTGSYGTNTVIDASLDHDYAALIPCIQLNDTVTGANSYRLRLHVDSGVAFDDLPAWLEGYHFSSTTAEAIIYNQRPLVLPSMLKAGTGLEVTVSSSSGSSDTLAIHFLGIRG